MATSQTGSGELLPDPPAGAHAAESRPPCAQSADALSAAPGPRRHSRSAMISGSSEHWMVTLRIVSALYVDVAPGPELSTVLARCSPPSVAVSRSSRSNVDPTGSSYTARHVTARAAAPVRMLQRRQERTRAVVWGD